jgi:uncharacterized protein (TIGR04141 family)
LSTQFAFTAYFAKILSRSSDCSHLVEQVKRTAELLYTSDDGFRKKLKAAMERHYHNAPRAWLDDRPRPGDWKFCLVSLGHQKKDLPLFAKCSIARLFKTLDQGGHTVLFAAV